MARADFGGTSSDFLFLSTATRYIQTSAATVTFWDSQTGGTRYTDLMLSGSPVTSIPVGNDGQIPVFQGPDGITQMWADAGGGIRVLIVSLSNVAAALAAAGSTTDALIATKLGDSASATRAAGNKFYQPVATPEAYGAVGNGVTNDFTAVQAAINSNLPVWLDPAKTYIVNGGLVARNGMQISSMLLPGTGYRANLKTTSGDMWTTPSSGAAFVTGFRFENVIMESAVGGGTLMRGMWTVGSFSNCDWVQNNAAKSCFDITGFIDVTFEGECQLQHVTTSSVSAFKAVTSTGNIAQVEFGNLRCSNSGTHFFYIEGTSGAVPINIGFTNVNFEVCNGGLAKLLSCRHVKLARCGAWDFSAAATNHLFHIDKSATSGAAPRAITFEDCIRDGSTAPTGGAQDIFVASTAGMTELNVLNCGHQLAGNYLVDAGTASGRVRGSGVTTLSNGLGMSTDDYQTIAATLSGPTIGNGSVTARFKRTGKQIDFHLRFLLGSTSAMGSSVTVNLPVAEGAVGASITSIRAFAIGASFYTLSGVLASSTTATVFTIGTGGLAANVTSTVPITWATGNALEFGIVYEGVA